MSQGYTVGVRGIRRNIKSRISRAISRAGRSMARRSPMTLLSLAAAAGAVTSLLRPQIASAMDPIIVGIDALAGDTGYVSPTAINNHNVVVGHSTTATGYAEAVIYTLNGGIQRLPNQDPTYNYYASDINDNGVIALTKAQNLGYACITSGNGQYENVVPYSFAYTHAINNAGVVVGNWYEGAALKSEYVYQGKDQFGNDQFGWQATRLTGGYGVAYDINDHGVIVGQAGNVAMRYTDAKGVEDLGAGMNSTALGINLSGTIVGSCYQNGLQRAFRYTDSQGLQILPDPYPNPQTGFMVYSVARAINDLGVSVGQTAISGEYYRAVMWNAQGNMIDLNTWLDRVDPADGAHWFLSDGVDINNNGIMVGYGWYGDGTAGGGEYRAFMLDVSSASVPEPSSATLLALGGAGLLLRRRRRVNRPSKN